MTKEELESKIFVLKNIEKVCERLISLYKGLMEENQEMLDEATLELSELELQLAKIEEQEDTQ